MRDLRVVFYSHVWVLDVLKQSLSLADDAVVVDVSTLSGFGWATRTAHTLVDLLTPGVTLESLCTPLGGLQFLPGPSVLTSDSAVRSAAGVLATCASDASEVVLLIDVEHAEQMASVIARATQYAVLWDVADAPGPALAGLAALLGDMGRLNANNWGGFTVYEHPERRVDDAEERTQLFHSILARSPSLVTPRPADLALNPLVDA